MKSMLPLCFVAAGATSLRAAPNTQSTDFDTAVDVIDSSDKQFVFLQKFPLEGVSVFDYACLSCTLL